MLQPKEENLETTLKKIDDHIELLSKVSRSWLVGLSCVVGVECSFTCSDCV